MGHSFCWSVNKCTYLVRWQILIFLVDIFLFKISFFLNWRIIALQNFVVFCQISTWSAIGIHTSSPFWNSLPSPSPLHPSGLIQSPCLSFLIHTANSRWLSILYGDVSFHVTLFIPLTLSSPLSMSISLLSMSVSPLLPCKEILQYHFSRFHIYALSSVQFSRSVVSDSLRPPEL